LRSIRRGRRSLLLARSACSFLCPRCSRRSGSSCRRRRRSRFARWRRVRGRSRRRERGRGLQVTATPVRGWFDGQTGRGSCRGGWGYPRWPGFASHLRPLVAVRSCFRRAGSSGRRTVGIFWDAVGIIRVCDCQVDGDAVRPKIWNVWEWVVAPLLVSCQTQLVRDGLKLVGGMVDLAPNHLVAVVTRRASSQCRFRVVHQCCELRPRVGRVGDRYRRKQWVVERGDMAIQPQLFDRLTDFFRPQTPRFGGLVRSHIHGVPFVVGEGAPVGA
jgi:hypothetical protein